MLPADSALIQLYPVWEGQFDTFTTWVNKAPSWLSGDIRGPAVCIDMKGRRCSSGGDFKRARDDDAFPVRFFWEMTINAPEAQTTAADPDPMQDFCMSRGGHY